ncbi:hypothetical protein Goklo_002936 [Gossypium klotzschianum]|uniref:Uncharacterized protein n=1 Tax=Gossypium klotzschianum TaxID=34286 RepID=A0A7J8VUQ2_9ROSI|nr:hypothetical protein [Gossypium klotzschianum]
MSKTTIKKGLHATGIMPLAAVDYEVDIEVLTMTFSLQFTLAVAMNYLEVLVSAVMKLPTLRKVELKNTSKSKAIDMLAGVP